MALFTLMYIHQALIATVNGGVVNSNVNSTTSGIVSADEIAVRIIGGEVTSIKEYPFAATGIRCRKVSVQRRHFSHICGGTYVAPRFVLSAAHCMVRPISSGNWIPENPRRFYAIAGATYVYLPSWFSIQMELIDKLLPHMKFRFSDMRNDIGLFRLYRPFRINSYVMFVSLPTQRDTKIFQRYKSPCVAAGWGRHVAGSNEGVGTYLRHVQIPLIPTDKCRLDGVQKDVHLCAGFTEGGRDACQGDSGGPLLCNGTQVGIVSWGQGCARPNSPGVYCRVDFYLDWLNETIAKNMENTLSPRNDLCISVMYFVMLFSCNIMSIMIL